MDNKDTDRFLEELYVNGAEFMEQDILRRNGIDPLQAPPEEPEEITDRHYAQMIAHLRSEGKYREETQKVIGPKELGWREPSFLFWIYRLFPAATAVLIGCMVGMLSMIELGRYFG